jgi:hypothetical protein
VTSPEPSASGAAARAISLVQARQTSRRSRRGAPKASLERPPVSQGPKCGKVSLRYDSRLYKIGIGRAHKSRQVKLLIADQKIRVIDPNGELIRELTLDPSRNYQPISPAYDVSDVPTHVSGMS